MVKGPEADPREQEINIFEHQLEPIRDWEAFKKAANKFIEAFPSQTKNAEKEQFKPLINLESEENEEYSFHFMENQSQICSTGSNESQHSDSMIEARLPSGDEAIDTPVSSQHESYTCFDIEVASLILTSILKSVSESSLTNLLDHKYLSQSSALFDYFVFLQTEQITENDIIIELEKILATSDVKAELVFLYKLVQSSKRDLLTSTLLNLISSELEEDMPKEVILEIIRLHLPEKFFAYLLHTAEFIANTVKILDLTAKEYSHVCYYFATFFMAETVNDEEEAEFFLAQIIELLAEKTHKDSKKTKTSCIDCDAVEVKSA